MAKTSAGTASTGGNGPADLTDRLEKIFPTYLVDSSKDELRRRLKEFPSNYDYYVKTWEGPDQPIQGDGWNGFVRLKNDCSHQQLAGIVLSNSCDIDEANASLRDRNIVFAPIIPFAAYEGRLRNAQDASAEKISGHLEAVRKQQKPGILYLPPSALTPETLVFFDEIASLPVGAFSRGERKRLFRLSNYGFYILVMKFAIYFTRFGEGLDRTDPTGGTAA